MARRRIKKPTIDQEEEFTACQGIWKHAWDPWAVPGTDRRYGGYAGFRIGKLCVRCNTTAVNLIDVFGRQETWRYKWPDGYSWAKDERPTREEYNLAGIAYYQDELAIEYNEAEEPEKPVSKKATVRKPKKAPAKKATPRPAKRHLEAVG